MPDDDIIGAPPPTPPDHGPLGTPSDSTCAPGTPASPVAPPQQPAQQPAQPPAWTPPGNQMQYQPRWRSVRGLGVALQALLWVALGVSVVSILALGNERQLAEDFFDGDLSIISDLDDATDFVNVTQALYFVLSIAILTLLIIYLWRAAKNIEMLGRHSPSLGAGWAIGAWFIPLANYILVPMVWAGAWKGSDTTVAPGEPNWKRAALTPLLALWWVTYAVASLAYAVGTTAFTDEDGLYDSIDDFRAASTFSLIGSVVLVVSAVLAIVFIRRLTRRFEIWGRHLGVDGSAPVA